MIEMERGTRRGGAARPDTALTGALVAELVGTFLLVFVGAGTAVAMTLATPASGANVTAIALAFGLAVLVAVYAFGHVSGAHINPTVTIALAAVRRFPWRAVPGYLAAQFAGAILASIVLWLLFGGRGRDEVALGATTIGPRGALAAFLAEVILGLVLVLVVLATVTDRRANPATSGLAIGLTIAAGIYVTLDVSGGSFNAARSLGPMIVSWQFSGWWVYLIAPLLGGVLGAFLYERLLRHGAPPTPEVEATVGHEHRTWREHER